jgi:hypothetical protein
MAKANPPLLSELLNEKEVAANYTVSVSTVRRWRLTGGGPRFIKIGALVRYRVGDVIAFLESRPTGGSLNQEPEV